MISERYEMRCDVPSCLATVTSYSLVAVKALALDAGWQVGKRGLDRSPRDYCPQHRKDDA